MPRFFFSRNIGWIAVLLLFLILYYVFKNDKSIRKVVQIKPSYVIAVKGNNIPLYAQVRGMVSRNEQIISLTNHSIEQSQIFHWERSKTRMIEKQHASIHAWYEICRTDIYELLNYPLFPHLPFARGILTILEMNNIAINSGLRIFGFLSPKHSSTYQFQLSVVSISVQVWISSYDNPDDSVLLFQSHNNNRNKYFNGVSNEQPLDSNKKYFFDIVCKSGDSSGSFSLKWKSSSGVFKSITKENLIAFYDEGKYGKNEVIQEKILPTHKHFLSPSSKSSHEESKQIRHNIYLLPFIDEKDVENLFPVCDYHPSYIPTIKQTFQGVWETHFTSVFPDDHTDIPYRLESIPHEQIIFGNPVLAENVANEIVGKVVHAIEQKHGNKYSLVSILNVEENADPDNGNRYLVELQLSQRGSERAIRFSEYVYLPKHANALCTPKNFKWDKNAEVNIILTSGHQGKWAKHFIDNVEKIYNDTKDQRMNVIIVDFDSKDVDLVQALQQSNLPRYTLLKRQGKFHKTEAIQAATNTIDNPNSIALQLDLHLVIPSDIIDHVRKHTIQGKMTCSPLLARLQCGANPRKPYGFWEISGYGIFGIYKSDWDIVGGMSVDKYQEKWGDEDWDLLDNVFKAGYEVERIKIKDFYHVFHSKSGMWHNMI